MYEMTKLRNKLNDVLRVYSLPLSAKRITEYVGTQPLAFLGPAFLLIAGLVGCSNTYHNRHSIEASNSTLLSHENAVSLFQHRLWFNTAKIRQSNTDIIASANTITELVVYIHGDGLPWLAKGKIALDPSPDYSLTWALMQVDPRPAAFISRPCYFGLAEHDPMCHPRLWTNERYSVAVVESLAHSIAHESQEHGFNHIRLVGYSGGASLAMLISELLNTKHEGLVGSVSTLAGNLDSVAWASHHHYSPLNGSLNPAEMPALSRSISQHHFCGNDDRNTPEKLAQRFFDTQHQQCIAVDATHDTGWLAFWQHYTQTLHTQ